ncbi:methionyl-tRNA formyltransferase [Candidatus Saccharibacteria bacterium RIFCSPHIGHO2_01_FULL_45_15]|nr:MAG: methionyl-tRNA formyltransferase [Candidatus Saccharibacteria bacterium RIFCSPHIGHO2_01_FULL_45_15]OGL27692.1 MAG: methionyl-tRNA formyltransferase [Candidatus Saccharibacteria bacterium RIFCSPHIGHO2_02_FULL_46_12]OGL32072.1 MAG: methionyl-tRNA formyltransferase [Candidatus Saccharibacteria bacterium RIFCSPHIGHO2_12_FULL_44_22]
MTRILQQAPNFGQTNPAQPIVFFGTEDFSFLTLKALVQSGYSISAVVTKPDSRQGRGQKLTPPKVKVYAEQHSIDVWQPIKLTAITEKIKALGSPVGVLVSYGKIIPQSVIDLFTPGIINIHPSLLPVYRGPSPVESAILNGDNQTGVSIMLLSADMDAGPVYVQKPLTLTGNEQIQQLYDSLGQIGIDLLVKHLPSILSCTLLPTAQKAEAATYCHLISKTDGVINWQQSATIIERKVRAYQNWPKTRTKIGSAEVIITSAHVQAKHGAQPGTIETCDEQAGILSIATGDGILVLDTIQPVGKKEMPVKAFLAGYKSQLIQ